MGRFKPRASINPVAKHTAKRLKKFGRSPLNRFKHEMRRSQKGGKFTIVDLALLSLEFGLSFKITAEFLEELRILPRGTYDRLSGSRGYRVKTFLEAAKERAEREAVATGD
jgi:hypothetical protein